MFWLFTCILSLSLASPTTGSAIAKAAEKIEDPSVRYIPDYVKLSYPMGDVPKETGVCTDVVIRTYQPVLESTYNWSMKTSLLILSDTQTSSR